MQGKKLANFTKNILLVSALVYYPTYAKTQDIDMQPLKFTKKAQLNQQKYSNKVGFGADNFANSTERAFSVKLAEGDYAVKVKVTAKQTTEFILFSEDRRIMQLPQALQQGQSAEYTFFSNVKTVKLASAEQDPPQGSVVGLRGDEFISRNWDDKLTIALSNQNVEFEQVEITQYKGNRILLAGDSTVADQASSDYASWGQFLPALVDNHLVINHARSGETLKSFIFSLRWDKLLSQTQAGDIVLIQFAHNDEKKQWPRTYSAADGAYPEYLRAFIADVKQKNALPVLVTPVARRFFKNGELLNTHEGYDKAVRNVGQTLNVPVIDLTAQTSSFYQMLGQEKSPQAFAAKGKDKTQHNHYGAWVIAQMVAKQLKAQFADKVDLSEFDFDGSAPPQPDEQIFSRDLWPEMRPVEVEISGS